MSRTRIAFFDVDGTLTTATSMFRFLRYYLAAHGHPAHLYDQRRQQLKSMTRTGTPREETNRAYFKNFADADAVEVAELAQKWFSDELRLGGYFNEHSLAAFRHHQEEGHRTVLVSGSFPALLSPIAAYLGADETWCTPPEVVRGRYTGALSRSPMIGDAKASAVLMATTAHRTAPEFCIAYGDHISDLPMLNTTGSAVVVGDDVALRTQARLRNWRILPTAPPPSEHALPRTTRSAMHTAPAPADAKDLS